MKKALFILFGLCVIFTSIHAQVLGWDDEYVDRVFAKVTVVSVGTPLLIPPIPAKLYL
jgi:hypothetical protein